RVFRRSPRTPSRCGSIARTGSARAQPSTRSEQAMGAAMAVATAVTFVWLGMVLAISFLETPLKFRAPGVTIPSGRGIGRLGFRGLHAAEPLPAIGLLVTLVGAEPGATAVSAGTIVVIVLVLQLAVVRPRLTKRSDRVLAGEQAPRSHAHHAFIGLECAKVLALLVTGVALLTA